jgi:hypothetical protein
MRLLFLLLIGLSLVACQSPLVTQSIPDSHDVGAQQIPIADSAYAGSSINVVAGSRQTLYTDGVHQYAGFYDAGGRLILAKRRLGENSWQKAQTDFSAGVEDAHNTISLIVDGAGYLHLAWGHHNAPLQYARSLEPGNLVMDEPRRMVGRGEQSVTYPQFFRLSDGNLLFLYREGGSGDGRLVLNHYQTKQQRWTRRQDNLIDGEGERSAYWDLTLDGEDRLHLAWNWRETPDVASNHDLLYARSEDGGHSWQHSDGQAYALPITQATAEVAAAIAQNHNLMNPPAIGADRWGRPYISSYWSPEPGQRPRFHLVYRNDTGWQTLPGPMAGENFELAGWGTKRPPISRAALLVESGRGSAWAHLIYRDYDRGGRVVAATVRDLEKPDWHYRYLTEGSVGAWEPSIDPAQWQRTRQAHLLLQNVDQLDGDDQTGSQQASPISLLIWSPD